MEQTMMQILKYSTSQTVTLPVLSY